MWVTWRWVCLAGIVGCFFCDGLKAAPRLSSDKPIVYDAKKRVSVAEGNAEFVNEKLRIQSDKILYFAENAKALAQGHVRITKEEFRVLSQEGAFWNTTQQVEVKTFRMSAQGHGICGQNLRGYVDERLIADHVVLDNQGVHDRDLIGLHIKARQGVVSPKHYVLLKDAVVHLGPFPILVLPVYRHSLEKAFVRFKSECTFLSGYKDKPNEQYGNYWRNDITFLPKWAVKPTIMLDYYRKQGIFTGIKAEYDDKWGYSKKLGKGEIDAACIHDENLGEYNRNRTKGHEVQNSRYWFGWKHQGHIGETNDVALHMQWMRDPDVIKDFRPAWNDGTKQHPDNFIEVLHRQDDAVISGLMRYKLNRFQRIQERLPEIRYEHAPVPLGDTGLFHQYGFGFSNLRERPLDKEDTEKFDEEYEKEARREFRRIDASYGVHLPLDITPACTLTPCAGFRAAHYFKMKQTKRTQYTRFLEQFGFDLRFRSYGDYDYTNEYWDIHRFRHLLQPVLQYRYMPGGHEGNSFIPAIDRAAIDANEQIPSMQEPDLLSRRDIDDCYPMHFMRFGIENSLYTNFEKGSGTKWLYLNAYQDFCFKQIQDDRKLRHTLSDTNLDFGWTPISFFTMNEKICYSFPEKQLLSMNTSVTFSESDLWSFSLTHTYSPGNPKSKTRSKTTSNQMTLTTTYRINSTNTFSMNQKMDLHKTDILSHEYVWHTVLAKTWNLDTKFIYNKHKGWEMKLIYQFVSW